jgi:hypothetical protein
MFLYTVSLNILRDQLIYNITNFNVIANILFSLFFILLLTVIIPKMIFISIAFKFGIIHSFYLTLTNQPLFVTYTFYLLNVTVNVNYIWLLKK